MYCCRQFVERTDEQTAEQVINKVCWYCTVPGRCRNRCSTKKVPTLTRPRPPRCLWTLPYHLGRPRSGLVGCDRVSTCGMSHGFEIPLRYVAPLIFDVMRTNTCIKTKVQRLQSHYQCWRKLWHLLFSSTGPAFRSLCSPSSILSFRAGSFTGFDPSPYLTSLRSWTTSTCHPRCRAPTRHSLRNTLFSLL